MRVGPGRIEIHVNGKRARTPDRKSRKQGPKLIDIFTRNAKRNQEAEKTVKRGGQSHGNAIGRGETVGRNGGSQGASEKNAGVGNDKKRSPKNGGTDGEVIFDVAGAGAKFRGGLAVFVDTVLAEAGVGLLIVAGEIEIVLDERRAHESVITDAVSAHPRIQHGKRQQK